MLGLLIAIINFFYGWLSRWENFLPYQVNLSLPSHLFMKHCSSRWLTLETSSVHLLEQWGALHNFINDVPKKWSALTNSNCFQKVSRLMTSPTMNMEAEILIAILSAKLFMQFTKVFQGEKPPTHVLHSELNEIVRSLLRRVLKAKSCKSLSKNFYGCVLKCYLWKLIPSR